MDGGVVPMGIMLGYRSGRFTSKPDHDGYNCVNQNCDLWCVGLRMIEEPTSTDAGFRPRPAQEALSLSVLNSNRFKKFD
jgi:hypothetical protein